MFKLESYITPIILSYVDKYVKNARAEKSQVSLWGGDVVFTNLDLRLDVLERELGLPFAFVSGHIHELHINVPWTRLHAEPIVITINTIECVLRLPDTSRKAGSSQEGSEASYKGGSERIRHRKQLSQDDAPPPGYVQSLINKIISNVKIVCNNLILKYVEEDIVLSLNTRWLCLSSANAFYEPAFTELQLPDLVLRKLLLVKDMTVCLDKRDASGRIETYQEPFLYRCSLTVHAAWIYDTMNSKIPRVSRYDIRSAQMNFSLTDTQLPMFLRIVNLCLALLNGEINDESVATSKGSPADKDFKIDIPYEEGGVLTNPEQYGENSGSWSGWAWNVGTTVGSALLPIYWEDDDDEDSPDNKNVLDILRQRVTHLGLYVDSASLVLKLSEISSPKDMKNSSSTGPLNSTSSRLSFSPFLRLDVSGFFEEVKSIGLHTVNVTGGISALNVTPVGKCTCGVQDVVIVIEDENKEESTTTSTPTEPILSSGSNEQKNYLRGSLFQKDYGDEEGTCKERKCSYEIDWDSHLQTHTESYLLNRTSAVAVDLLYHLGLPDDFDSEHLSVMSDLENSDMEEKSICRIVFGPVKVLMNSGSVHRLSSVLHYLSKYDYAPYSSEPSDDELELVQENLAPETLSNKIRIYQVTAINPSVQIQSADHLNLQPAECILRREKFEVPDNNLNLGSSTDNKASTLKNSDRPSLVLNCDCIDSQFVTPMYPRKVVSQSQKDVSLVKKSYSSLSLKLMHLSCRVLGNDDQGVTWFQPTNLEVKMASLLMPGSSIWSSSDLVLRNLDINIEACKVRLSRPQSMVIHYILSTWREKDPSTIKLCPTLILDSMVRKLPSLTIVLSKWHALLGLSKTSITIQAHCNDFALFISNVSSLLPILSTSSPATLTSSSSSFSKTYSMSPGRALNKNMDESRSHHWLKLDLQIPTNPVHSQSVLSLFALQIGQVDINVDPKALEWLTYAVNSPSSLSKKPIPNATASGDLLREDRVTPTPQNLKVPSKTKSRRSRSKSPNKSEHQPPNKQRIQRTSTITDMKSSTAAPAPQPSRSRHYTTEDLDKVSKDVIGLKLNYWYPVMRALLLQIQIDSCHVYLPKKTLAYSSNGKPLRKVRDVVANAAGSKIPLIAVSIPSIVFENVAHKPMIHQFLQEIPFKMPESVWNLHRDNLPWTLKLKEFSLFNFRPNGNGDKEFVLEPISTSCTIGVNGKDEGIGLCIHADMSSLKVSINEHQLSQLVQTTEKIMHILVELSNATSEDLQQQQQPSIIGGNSFLPKNNSKSGAAVIQSSSMPSPQASMPAMKTSSEISKLEVEPKRLAANKTESSSLSIWVQWTICGQANLSLITNNLKLQMIVEDYQSSFDWSPVYFQTKVKINNVGIKHFLMKDKEWKPGANNGVILTFGNQITNDIVVVNAENNVLELLSSEKPFEVDKSCINLVFTRAECENVHSKWKDLVKGKTNYVHHQESTATAPPPPGEVISVESNSPRFLSEVDIKISPLDIVFDLAATIPFLKMISKLTLIEFPNNYHPHGLQASSNLRKRPVEKEVLGLELNNNNLPLVYLKAMGIRLFIMANNTETTGNNQDLLLLTCGSFNITPQADNPISRILIKPDLYHLSQPVIDIPGASIENRQYQMDAKQIGLFSGSWKEISEKSILNSTSSPAQSIGLKSMNQNPALEWNIASCMQQDDISKKESKDIILLPLVSKFDWQIIFAPAIVLKSKKNQPEVIAGHSIEVNVTSDFNVTLSMDQLQLCSLLCQETIAMKKAFCFTNAEVSQTLKSTIMDSGVECESSFKSTISARQSSQKLEKEAIEIKPDEVIRDPANNEMKITSRFVPFEFFLTGSKISIRLYSICPFEEAATNFPNELKKSKQKQRSKVMEDVGNLVTTREESDSSYHHNAENYLSVPLQHKNVPDIGIDIGYEASEEGSISVDDLAIKKSDATVVQPLAFCVIVQPHMFITCSSGDQKFETSVYDASIAISPRTHLMSSSDGLHIPTERDYKIPVFKTRQGNPNKLGIPPSLITITIKDFLLDSKMTIGAKIQRPFKLTLSEMLQEELEYICKTISQASGVEELNLLLKGCDDIKCMDDEEEEEKAKQNDFTDEIRHLLKYISVIDIETTQMVIELIITSAVKKEKHEMLLGMFASHTKIKMYSDDLMIESTSDNNSLKKVNSNISLNKIFIRTIHEKKTYDLMSPLSFKLNSSYTWMEKGKLPLTNLQLIINHLTLFASPHNIMIVQEYVRFFNHRYNDTTSSSPDQKCGEESKNLNYIATSAKNNNSASSSKMTEQHYVDDLRAGAFHVIEKFELDHPNSTDNVKPYQILVSNQPIALTWMYPNPRTLTRVTVLPMPLMSGDESFDYSPEYNEIPCSLQYWDDCIGSYQTYASFHISEESPRHLDLPLISDRKKIAVSDKWRILVHTLDIFEEAGFGNRLPFEAKSLVSVVRIDSYFSTTLTPRIKMSANLESFQLSFVNPFFAQSPTKKDAKANAQEIAAFILDSTRIGVDVWDREDKLESELNIRCKTQLQVSYVDFLLLAKHHLILPCKIQCHAHVMLTRFGSQVEVQMHSKQLIARYGHFANEGVKLLKHIWMTATAAAVGPIKTTKNEISKQIISAGSCSTQISSIQIRNGSQSPMRVGQADTEESILIKPGDTLQYPWRSQKARLMLRLSLESVLQDSKWKWSEPFTVRDGTFTSKIDYGAYVNTIVVCVQKTGVLKYFVNLNGLISTASLLKESLEVRFILKKHVSFIAHMGNQGKDDVRSILPNNAICHSHLLEVDYVHAVRIRLSGIGTPWSGDIPLNSDSTRKSSVLVRIPHKDKGKCITVWCKLIYERLNGGSQRCLFLLSPMYVCRSLLSNPMRLLIQPNKEDAIESEMMLEGRDVQTSLETYESADTKYNLRFIVAKNLPPSEPVLLSWGIIEQVRDKNYIPTTIENIVEELVKMNRTPSQWPFAEDVSIDSKELNDQPKTDVQVRFTQLHPLCNTLVAEINPWCLMINQVEHCLILKMDNTGSLYNIQPNSVLVPPSLMNNTFYFGLTDEDCKEYYTPPLQLSNQEWHFHSLIPAVDGIIPLEGICHIKIFMSNEKLCLLTIKAKNENGMRVMTIIPTFQMVNKSSLGLTVAGMSLFENYNNKSDNFQCSITLPEEMNKPVPFLYFEVLGEKKTGDQILFDGFQTLAVKSGGDSSSNQWSELVNLGECRNSTKDDRRIISLPIDVVDPMTPCNRLMVLTLHQRNGQVYLVIQDNLQAQLTVHNGLPVKTKMLMSRLKGKTPLKVKPEEQIVKIEANSTMYVTSACTNEDLSKIENQNAAFRIYFSNIERQPSSLSNEGISDWEVIDQTSWSNGIDSTTSFYYEQFCNIPGHGDVSIHLEKVAENIHCFIDPISDLEISAKDIRSRIISSPSHIHGGGGGGMPTSPASDFSEAESDSTGILEQSFFTVKSPMSLADASFKTDYKSLNSSMTQMLSQPCVTIICDEVCLVLTDDCVESYNQVDEYIRFTMDTLLLTLRPKVINSHTLRSLNGQMAVVQDLCLTLGGLQIDNQMFQKGSYDFPIFLKSQKSDDISQQRSADPLQDGNLVMMFNQCQHSDYIMEDLREKSHFKLSLILDCNTNRNVVTSVAIRLQPINLFVEDAFVYKMADVLNSLILENNVVPSEEESTSCLKEVMLTSSNLANPMWLDRLTVEPLNILVSVHASIKAYVGLDQSPLSFGRYHHENFRVTNFALGSSIAKHYISGTLFRAGWVVGSLEMIGSPTGLTRAVGDGIKDFVGLPYHGLFNGPWAFFTGIVHGSSSLVKHVSAGTLTSVTNFASSVSKNLDRLSLDRDHCQRNEVARRSLPQGLSHGLSNGLSGVGISLLGAIGGIAHHPIKSLIENGPSPTGIVGGLTRGLVGVVTKPLGGAAELVAQTGQGLLVGTGWSQKLKQREPSLPQHICSVSSSKLKYEWTMNCHGILMMIEVTQKNSTGLLPATLVLTSDAIFVMSEEEDCQICAFSLNNIVMTDSKEDPTLLQLSPSGSGADGKNIKDEHEVVTNERIVQFVMESGFHVTVSDIEQTDDDDVALDHARLKNSSGGGSIIGLNKEETNNSNNNNTSLTFYVNPSERQAFVDAFEVALDQLRGYGFVLSN